MTPTKKVAVPESSIGVDMEQPLHNKDNEIIADTKEHFNRQATKSLTANMVTAGKMTCELSLWKNYMIQHIRHGFRL